MKKIWAYIAMFFAGVSAGITVAIKYLVPEKVVVNVKKQRIKGNSNEMSVDVPVNGEVLKKASKTKRGREKKARVPRRLRKKV